MIDLQFSWIGNGFEYGQRLDFFAFSIKGIELVFFIYPTGDPDSKHPFSINKIDKKMTANKIDIIEEKVKSIHLIETDDDFRKRFKRSYNIIKITTAEEKTITIGSYCDSDRKPTSENSHVVCTMDFINLLSKSINITTADQLDSTPFEAIKCVISKKELAKELLK